MGLRADAFRWPWQRERHRQNVERAAVAARLAGGVLPDAPRFYTEVEHFEAARLARALEQSVTSAKGDGFDKVVLTIDVDDAARLAAALHRASLT